MADFKQIFDTFSKCELSTKLKSAGNGTQLKYASWCEVWEQILKLYPNAEYEVLTTADNEIEWKAGTGSIVRVKLTIDGHSRHAWLAVSDTANRALPNTTIDRKTGEIVEHPVTSTDVANTVTRCLCKAAAMFGLGLYIYAGEDMPEAVREAARVAEYEAQEQRLAQFAKDAKEVTDRPSFDAFYQKYKDLAKSDKYVDTFKELSKKYPKV